MRRALVAPAAGALLAGPIALAFFAGGYFDEPRLVAAIVAWAGVLVVALTSRRPLPATASGRAAVLGLALLCGWTAASLAWAPLAEPATDATGRLLLYLGAFVAAIALLRERAVARAVEPVFAFGVVGVMLYGLSGRLFPTLIELDQSWTAGGRLEQPITYWNAQGALAAMGFVLCARLAGDRSRALAVRALAAAGCAPVGAAVYLTYSRGAIGAGLVGLVVLLAVAPTWPQLRAVVGALLAGCATAGASAAFSSAAAVEATRAQRTQDGAVILAVLVLVALTAGLATALAARAERRGRLRADRLGIASRLPAVAVVAVALTSAGIIAGGIGERGDPLELQDRQGAARLTSVTSRRYDYWRTGISAMAEHPVRGLGAGGFRVVWLRERPVDEGVLEVHSLELEIALELGLVGVVGLLLLVGGTGAAARAAVRRSPGAVAGSLGACTVWLIHATIDWDWQFPAVTLPALVMAGGIIAVREGERAPAAASPHADDGRLHRTTPVPPPVERERRPVGSGV